MQTGLRPQLAPSDRLREAKTRHLHPAGRLHMLQAAGCTAIRIQPKDESKTFIREWVPDTKIEDSLVSATIEAVKP